MARKLKLALLSVHSCPMGSLGGRDTGGMNVYVRELAGQLGKEGHLVDVYTRIHDAGEPQIIELGQNARLVHLKAGESADIPKLEIYNHLPEFVFNLENFKKENGLRYDLIFSHYWLSGWAGKSLQLSWDAPHIIMFHTLGAVKNALGIGEDEPELRIEAERDLVNYCYGIIAATEQEKEQLIAYYNTPPEAISIIPCGVNLDLFQPVNSDDAKRHLGLTSHKVILFVGRIEPIKGLDLLLRALTYLKDEPGLRLLIVGGDIHSRDEVARLQQLSRDLKISDLVTFTGSVKQTELPAFYSAADVCVIPSYSESFGLVALESLACGTPVVATRVGGMEEIIRQGETGYVVKNNDPHLLAEKLSLILARANSKDKRVNEMRASVVRFGWSSITRMIAEECQKVLADYLPHNN
ncbi:MAG TPA: glycosyltransferase family 1 protein [Dehalococcoidia bacterium]|nr:glycosyltransferase family 1 protein [Dehalococcoidia bacterium]